MTIHFRYRPMIHDGKSRSSEAWACSTNHEPITMCLLRGMNIDRGRRKFSHRHFSPLLVFYIFIFTVNISCSMYYLTDFHADYPDARVLIANCGDTVSLSCPTESNSSPATSIVRLLPSTLSNMCVPRTRCQRCGFVSTKMPIHNRWFSATVS